MKRHKVRAIIGVVVLLLAVTLLTGYVSPPFVEVEVPLFVIPVGQLVLFLGVALLVLIGFIFLIRWILPRFIRWVFRKVSHKWLLIGGIAVLVILGIGFGLTRPLDFNALLFVWRGGILLGILGLLIGFIFLIRRIFKKLILQSREQAEGITRKQIVARWRGREEQDTEERKKEGH